MTFGKLSTRLMTCYKIYAKADAETLQQQLDLTPVSTALAYEPLDPAKVLAVHVRGEMLFRRGTGEWN